MTWIGTVSGWNLGRAKLTLKAVSVAGTATEHGVLQVWPVEARASAPEGTESSWSCTTCGAGLSESSENDEQPARAAPDNAITMTRRMTATQTAANCHNPRTELRSVGNGAQPRPTS